jgi:hypothetical protein
VFGAWLDSTCDRLADAAILSGLLLWFTGRGDDRLLAGVALFCLVSGSLVSYAKARAEGLGLRCDVGLAERLERLALVLIGRCWRRWACRRRWPSPCGCSPSPRRSPSCSGCRGPAAGRPAGRDGADEPSPRSPRTDRL